MAAVHVRFRDIDVLRGFAALTVVLSHYLPYWDRYVGELPVLVPSAFGYFAVKLFFVVSGFVIFMTLERCRTVGDFAVLRFSRLFPAYWASLAVVTLIRVLVFDHEFWLAGFIVNATMFQEFVGYGHFDAVYWSLSVELAFYLNVAWLFVLGLHRRVYSVVFAWLALASIWVLAAQNPGSVTTVDGLLASDARHWLALFFALDYAPYFALGILFYHVKRQGWAWPAPLLIALAAGVEFLLASWEGLALVSIIGVLVWLATNGYLRFLVNGVSLWLGTISYSLYLVHRNLGYRVLGWLAEHDVNVIVALALTLALAFSLATALAYGVEIRGSAAVRAWYKRRNARGEDATAGS